MNIVSTLILLSISVTQAWANPSFIGVHDQKRQIVFNLTGGVNGFGDVTGPLWILLEFRKIFPNDTYNVVIDPFAEKALKDMYGSTDLNELEDQLQLKIVNEEESSRIKKADYSFEMFAGGRRSDSLIEHPYTDAHTINIISDTMHGTSLDEIRYGNNHLYFKPPGIGRDRSGILNNPDLQLFHGKVSSERRRVASGFFKGTLVEEILLHKRFPEAKLGFIYGAHNTKWNLELVEQTDLFLKSLKESHSSTQPIIIFSPNKAEDLKMVLAHSSVQVVDLKQLQTIQNLIDGIYIVPLGCVSSKQYTGLIASSEIPVLIEGNSSISTALRLNIPFVMYRSPWNAPQIFDIIQIENQYLKSSHFGDNYSLGWLSSPNFERFLPEITSPEKSRIFYQAINIRIPTFPKKVAFLIELIEKINNFTPSLAGDADLFYLKLSDEIQRRTHDVPLEFSLIENAFRNGLISEATLKLKTLDLERRGTLVENLKARFIEKQPKPDLGVPKIKTEAVPSEKSLQYP